MSDFESRLQKTIDATKNQLASIRTSRANTDILANVQVEYYGSMVPLQQVASVSVPEPMLFVLNVFDKSAVQSVEKAIMTSDLNLNPQTEGSIIRVRLPELTEERRKELVKVVGKQIEEGKVAIRNLRRDYIDKIKSQEKNKDISEDDSKKEQDNIQKATDKFTGILDTLSKEKEQEILTI